jgi:hypothetical protein
MPKDKLTPVVVRTAQYEKEQRMIEKLRLILRLYTDSSISLKGAKEGVWKTVWTGDDFLSLHKE